MGGGKISTSCHTKILKINSRFISHLNMNGKTVIFWEKIWGICLNEFRVIGK
jgi:hypothetical protein